MNQILSDKIYPIQLRWALKEAFKYGLFALVALGLFLAGLHDIRLIVGVGVGVYLIVLQFLLRWTFHYSLEEQFLVIRSGIIAKQERHLPYGVIQNVFVRQGVLDRLFKIASLTIENASQAGHSGRPQPARKWYSVSLHSSSKRNADAMSGGNGVHIFGLSASHAQLLKEALLQKMKENPLMETSSGL